MPSWIWTAFEKTNEARNVKCLDCDQALKRKDTSTKTMWSHLRSKHPDLFMKLKKSQEESPFRKSPVRSLHSPLKKVKLEDVNASFNSGSSKSISKIKELSASINPAFVPLTMQPQITTINQAPSNFEALQQALFKAIDLQHQAFIDSMESRIVDLLVRNNLPLSFVEDPDFEFMVSTICPGYQVLQAISTSVILLAILCFGFLVFYLFLK